MLLPHNKVSGGVQDSQIMIPSFFDRFYVMPPLTNGVHYKRELNQMVSSGMRNARQVLDALILLIVLDINSVCSISHDFYGGCRDSAEGGRFCHA